MITLGNSAFKPYYRDAQVLEVNEVDTKTCASTLSDSPENPMDLLSQLSLLANLKNQLDSSTLAQLGDLQETVQSAAAILQQLGVSLPPAPPLISQPSIEQLIASHAGSQAVHSSILGPSTSTPQSCPSLPPTAPPSATPSDENGKNKRKRTTFTNLQQAQLEREYEQDQYMPRSRRLAVADALRLTESQVKTWFQNRRAKDKKTNRITEVIPCSSIVQPQQSVQPTVSNQGPYITHQPQSTHNPTSLPGYQTHSNATPAVCSPPMIPLANQAFPTAPPMPLSSMGGADLYGSQLSSASSLSHLPPSFPSTQTSRSNDYVPQLSDLGGGAFSYNQLNALNGLNLAPIQPPLSTDLYSAFGYPPTNNPGSLLPNHFGQLPQGLSTLTQAIDGSALLMGNNGLLPVERRSNEGHQEQPPSSATAITPPMQNQLGNLL